MPLPAAGGGFRRIPAGSLPGLPVAPRKNPQSSLSQRRAMKPLPELLCSAEAPRSRSPNSVAAPRLREAAPETPLLRRGPMKPLPELFRSTRGNARFHAQSQPVTECRRSRPRTVPPCRATPLPAATLVRQEPSQKLPPELPPAAVPNPHPTRRLITASFSYYRKLFIEKQ